MIKPKGYLYLGLGMIGAIAMGIGCAQENLDSTATENKTAQLNSAELEPIRVEIMMEDGQHEADLAVAADEAPASSTTMTSTSVGGMPNIPADCSDPTKPNINCQMAQNYAGGAAPGVGGPGIDGLGYGGFGPGFAGDVPYGPGFDFGGPWFGLGYPFYVADFIIVDDDSHRRHRHHHDDDTDEDNID